MCVVNPFADFRNTRVYIFIISLFCISFSCSIISMEKNTHAVLSDIFLPFYLAVLSPFFTTLIFLQEQTGICLHMVPGEQIRHQNRYFKKRDLVSLSIQLRLQLIRMLRCQQQEFGLWLPALHFKGWWHASGYASGSTLVHTFTVFFQSLADVRGKLPLSAGNWNTV